jgi:hypothetical protein
VNIRPQAENIGVVGIVSFAFDWRIVFGGGFYRTQSPIDPPD